MCYVHVTEIVTLRNVLPLFRLSALDLIVCLVVATLSFTTVCSASVMRNTALLVCTDCLFLLPPSSFLI